MSNYRLMTEYEEEAPYASMEKRKLYCEHVGSVDIHHFMNEDGSTAGMLFSYGSPSLYDAMMLLLNPFDHEAGSLKKGVEPWDKDVTKSSSYLRKKE